MFSLSWADLPQDDAPLQTMHPETGPTRLQNDLDNVMRMIVADDDVASRPVTIAQQVTTPILSGNEYNLRDDLLTFLFSAYLIISTTADTYHMNERI